MNWAEQHQQHAYAPGKPAFTAHPWTGSPKSTWRVWCRCGASITVMNKRNADLICDMLRDEEAVQQ